MDIGFATALLVLGGILVVTAALSGWLHGTVLSASVLSVLAGVALSLTGVLSVSPDATIVLLIVELALILTLFSDGLYVERELLEQHWGPAARALALAMPVTLVLLALAAKALFPALSWSEAFLLGAVLSPTDPVVTSSVVTSERVPRVVRHTLNLESGVNDGLALPFVLFFLVLATNTGNAVGEAVKLGGQAVVGAVIGLALAFVGGRALSRLPQPGVTERYEGVYALGIGLAAYGLAEVTYGNGLIAAFVAGIALAVARHDVPEAFSEFNETLSSAFQVITFVVFGAVVEATGYGGNTGSLLVFIAFALVVARPLAVAVALVGVELPRPQKVFVAWFGPKGVASILFALLVLASDVGNRQLVFEVSSFTVLASIFAHGLTDTLGAAWIERRLEGREQAPGYSS